MEGVISQGPLFIACLVLLMGVVIVVHELGHYLAGRVYGVAVESFSVGFGKPMIERRDRSGTRWRINWIPLGGFVAFMDKRSMEEAEDPSDVPKGVAFDDIGPLKRSSSASQVPSPTSSSRPSFSRFPSVSTASRSRRCMWPEP